MYRSLGLFPICFVQASSSFVRNRFRTDLKELIEFEILHSFGKLFQILGPAIFMDC
jgi:hypothetical protein